MEAGWENVYMISDLMTEFRLIFCVELPLLAIQEEALTTTNWNID